MDTLITITVSTLALTAFIGLFAVCCVLLNSAVSAVSRPLKSIFNPDD